MRNLRLLFLALLLSSSQLYAQDSPCDCSDMATSNDCSGGVYADLNAAKAAMNPFVPASPLSFSSNGDSYEFCYKYTPGANETTVGLVNYVNVGGGCAFTRGSWTAYEAGCSNPISGTVVDNNAAEFTVTPGVEYSFCVTLTADANCPGGEINNIENFLYAITSTPPPGGGGPCSADVGTFTIAIDGVTQTGNEHYVANGEEITITSNGDNVDPPAAGSDAVGIGYNIFSCEPTFDPATETPDQDPCFLGASFDLSHNISDQNSGDASSSLSSYSELWFLPSTMDDMQSTSAGGSDDGKGADTDGDGCWDGADAIHVIYSTPPAPPEACGTCSTPDCGITQVAAFANRSQGYWPNANCNEPTSFIEDATYVTYHTVTADANGALGFAQNVQVSSNGCESKSIVLRPIASSCDANTDISPNVTNENSFASGFNPEFYGLTPNATYVAVVTTTIPAGCQYYLGCLVAYDIPNAPTPPPAPGPCEMQDGTYNTCNCEFKDSGTETDDYSANENYSYTICPDDNTKKLQMDFTELDLADDGDIISIYDGQDNTAPLLYTDKNTSTAPATSVKATPSNASGCLTIEFESNASGEGTGWRADVSCFTECTDPVAADINNGTIKICVGDEIAFDATSSTSNSTGGMKSYAWDFDDGTTSAGVNPRHTFSAPGRYTPTLVVTNDDDCYSKNALTAEILVGTVANFNGMTGGQVCEGADLNLTAAFAWPTVVDQPTYTPPAPRDIPVAAGQEIIPIDISGYGAGQTITSASDIVSVCMNMEHSAIDDIIITLIAPSGESVMFHNRGGQAVALGEPTMSGAALEGLCFGNTDTGRGTGWDYCFKTGASETLVDHANANWSSPYSCYQIPAGDYAPLDPFSNLIGATINGTWVIEFQDVYPNDDGTVFSWDITFSPSLLPASATVQPVLANAVWSGADISSTSGNDVTVTPSDVNNTDYTLTITDDFGCTFDTTIQITIDPQEDASFNYSKTNYCVLETDPTVTITGTPGGAFSTNDPITVDPSTGEITLSTSTAGGPYTITYTTNGTCNASSTVQVSLDDLLPADFSYPKGNYCNSETDPVVTITGVSNGTFAFDVAGIDLDPNTGDIDLSSSTAGAYVISYTTPGDCGTTETFNITIENQEDPSFDYPSDNYCLNAANPLPTAVYGSGSYSTTDPIDVNPTTGEINLAGSTVGGPYTITHATGGNCSVSETFQVTITLTDDATFAFLDSYCANDASSPVPTGSFNPNGNWSVDNSGLAIDPASGQLDILSSTPGDYTITYQTNDCPASFDRAVKIEAMEDASFEYEKYEYCYDENNPSPINVVTAGGAFSSIAGQSVASLSLDEQDGSINFAKGTPGTFKIYHQTSGKCFTIDSVTIRIDAPVNAEWTGTTISNKSNDDIDLRTLLDPNTQTGGVFTGEYVNHSFFDPTGVPQGEYEVTYSVENGLCKSEYSDYIVVITDQPPYLPNAFSPNGDGLNDHFYAIGSMEGTSQYELKVFNRWGENVFESTDPKEYWDGTKLTGTKAMSGVYTYTMSYLDSDNQPQKRIGSVLLLN